MRCPDKIPGKGSVNVCLWNYKDKTIFVKYALVFPKQHFKGGFCNRHENVRSGGEKMQQDALNFVLLHFSCKILHQNNVTM